MATAISNGSSAQVFVGEESGLTVVAPGTPLTRLNYYDGKFLRADDLDVEQAYFQALTWLSNIAGGSGVVYGFDIDPVAGADQITLAPGLAIDPSGHVLLLPRGVTLDIQQLIDETERLRVLLLAQRGMLKGEFSDCIAESIATTPPGTTTVVDQAGYYLITIAPAGALCGEDYAYGTLCEEACATSVQRPRRLDGIAVRAWSFTPRHALVDSAAVTMTQLHLRSRLASARFADEQADFASLLDAADLYSTVWCHGACAPTPNDVPLALLARSGSTTLFLDEWAARRELIETPPRRYWAGRMAMRPLAVFLAQVLQFQCQLRDVLPQAAPLHTLILNETVLTQLLAATDVAAVRNVVSDLPLRPVPLLPQPSRALIGAGIVELPSAGYLPVTIDTTVNDQVRALLGDGVDLTFCVVRPDYIPHALEEAQHMDRISLLVGLDDPTVKPAVEILVPDGEIIRASPKIAGTGWEGRVQLTPALATGTAPVLVTAPPPGGAAPALTAATMLTHAPADVLAGPGGGAQAVAVGITQPPPGLALHGAGRSELLATGGARFHFAAATETQQLPKVNDLLRGWASLATAQATDLHLLQDAATAQAKTTVQTAPSDTQVARIMRVAFDASTYTSQQLAAQPADAVLATSVSKFAPTLDPRSQVGALWATLGCDRNPFGLRLGELTAVQLTVDIALPGARGAVLTHEVRGDFTVEQITPTLGTAQRISGILSGLGSTKLQTGTQATTQHSGAFSRRATLVLSQPAGQAPSFDLYIAAPDGKSVAFDIHVTWDGNPVIARIGLQLGQLTTTITVPLGTFTANPDVLGSGNPTNTLARSALSILGAALADPSFAQTAETLLFPPPAAPTSELTVKAHRNWVLFRRARTKECAPDRVDVPLPVQNFDIFELSVTDAQQVQLVRQALLSGDSTILQKLPPRYVDRVQYAGGSTTIDTVTATLRASWGPHINSQIEWAAIAETSPADSVVLQRSRVVALEQALATTVDPTAQVEQLTNVPQQLLRAGADGAILILTGPTVVATTATLVIRLPFTTGEAAIRFFENTDINVRTKEVLSLTTQALNSAAAAAGAGPQLVGKVNFDVGTADLTANQSQTLLAEWQKTGTGHPSNASLWVFSKEDDAAAEPALESTRATTIASALGTAGVTPTVSTVSATIPGGCPSVTFLFSQG